MNIEESRFFRDQIRSARTAALSDSEGYHPIVAALERLGSMLQPKGKGLGQFQESLLAVARRAKAAPDADDDRGAFMPLEILFAAVKNGRNDAVHEGAYARHLVRNCVELALLVEEGLMADSTCVADFMVRDPECAETWQQVALARQRMLTSSFSCLPIKVKDEWKLLSDYAIAMFLANSANPRRALRERIATVLESNALTLDDAILVSARMPIQEAVRISVGRPVLVVEEGRLLGIATPFDFL